MNNMQHALNGNIDCDAELSQTLPRVLSELVDAHVNAPATRPPPRWAAPSPRGQAHLGPDGLCSTLMYAGLRRFEAMVAITLGTGLGEDTRQNLQDHSNFRTESINFVVACGDATAANRLAQEGPEGHSSTYDLVHMGRMLDGVII